MQNPSSLVGKHYSTSDELYGNQGVRTIDKRVSHCLTNITKRAETTNNTKTHCI